MTMEKPDSPASSAAYQIFMLVLCIYALAALALQGTVGLRPTTATILDYADYAVCGLFFADFVYSLARAPNRWKYLATWGWLDLLSSIPTVDAARWGRAARVLRVFRVLRGLRATKLLAGLILKRRAESSILAASLVVLLMVVSCSIGVLHFEDDPASNIKSAEDAMWWSFVTITTVGYGDRFPVTTEGRLIGALLMSAGVGLFGVFSGFLAAWFLGSESSAAKAEAESDLQALRAEIAALRETVSRLEPGRAAQQEGGTA
jgi:voltage-gated potassium channel